MRLITRSTRVAFGELHPEARASLAHWMGVTKAADWTDVSEGGCRPASTPPKGFATWVSDPRSHLARYSWGIPRDCNRGEWHWLLRDGNWTSSLCLAHQEFGNDPAGALCQLNLKCLH